MSEENQNATKKPASKALTDSAGSEEPKLYEITAIVSYSVVIRADSREAALKHVETWEHAWDANAELLEANNVDILDVRDGDSEDAHFDISSQNSQE